jgi:hypothetical protein
MVDDEFADWICNQFDDNYDYNSKRKEIDSKDYRVSKIRTVDINSEYKEFKEYEKSDAYRYTQIATNLLSHKFDVTGDQLTDTLQSKYGLSQNECSDVLKNLANSKNIDIHQNSYTKAVTLRKR